MKKLYFKDCIGKKIVRMEGKDMPSPGLGSRLVRVIKRNGGGYNWDVFSSSGQTLRHEDDYVSSSWDDGFWEFYEPEKIHPTTHIGVRIYRDKNRYIIFTHLDEIYVRGVVYHTEAGTTSACISKMNNDKWQRWEGPIHPEDPDYKEKETEYFAEDFMCYVEIPNKESITLRGGNMKRIVNILVADKDQDNDIKDVEKCVLYHKCNVVTTETDEEIWFRIGLDEIVKKHNDWKAEQKDEDGDALQSITLETVFRDITEVITF